MRVRPLRMLLAAVVAVLLAGAVFAAEPASGRDDGDRACHTDVRCGGQSATTTTGPLAAPESWSAVIAVALLAAGGVFSGVVPLHDRLAASRLFRPPRLAA